MGGTGADYGFGVAADGSGNVYITGQFASAGADFNPGGSGGVLTSAGGGDVFVGKYDPSGTFLWAKSMGGTGSDFGRAVAVDGSGNVYVTGEFAAVGADFNPGGSGGALTAAGGNDVFVARYDPNDAFLWAKSMGGTGSDFGYGVAVDGLGNVYATGQMAAAGADFNPGGSGGALTSLGGNDVFAVRLRQRCEDFISLTELACNSFIFNGVTYTASGTYVDTFTSLTYCDSIVTLDLTILDTVWYAVPVTACDTYLFNGQTYTNSGSYTHSFASDLGCDSIVTLNLIINLSSDSLVSGHYCDSVTFNGKTYTASGTYLQEYTSTGGCDSNFTYKLTIGQSSSDAVTQTACDSFVFDTTVYTTTGIHIVTVTNESGCDSTIILNLTINHSSEASVVRTGSTLTVNSAERYQWINCDDNTIIPEATAQSYTATQNGNYAVIITANGCNDTSECVLVDNITGINELGVGNKVLLYPNPSDSRITIQTEEALKDAAIRLISVVGQLVSEQAGVSGILFTVDMMQYANGVYFVEISEEGKTVRMKVIKN
jgi:hypothetical protein